MLVETWRILKSWRKKKMEVRFCVWIQNSACRYQRNLIRIGFRNMHVEIGRNLKSCSNQNSFRSYFGFWNSRTFLLGFLVWILHRIHKNTYSCTHTYNHTHTCTPPQYLGSWESSFPPSFLVVCRQSHPHITVQMYVCICVCMCHWYLCQSNLTILDYLPAYNIHSYIIQTLQKKNAHKRVHAWMTTWTLTLPVSLDHPFLAPGASACNSTAKVTITITVMVTRR